MDGRVGEGGNGRSGVSTHVPWYLTEDSSLAEIAREVAAVNPQPDGLPWGFFLTRDQFRNLLMTVAKRNMAEMDPRIVCGW